MSTDNLDLKPCPFCGEWADIDMKTKPGFYVRCESCVSDGPEKRTLEQAAAAWNQRAPTEPEQ